jgi:hypothetical protein
MSFKVRVILSCSVFGFWLGCASLFGQATDEPQIKQLAWMVGDWQTVEKSDKGDLIVHLTAKESENHQAMMFYISTEKDGQVTPKYNGMYYWDPEQKTFKIVELDNNGDVAAGTYEQTGNRVVQLVKVVSKNGDFELKSDWEIRPREFHFVGQYRAAGKADWVAAVDQTYSRVGIGALKTDQHAH